MIAVIDYGVGNLFSLKSSLAAVGAESMITDSPDLIKKADKLILPGVGAFYDAMEKLKAKHLDVLIKDMANVGKPIMGICLGMQLLFDKSFEYGEHEGLGLIRGSVIPMEGKLPPDLKIPHIGWNVLNLSENKHEIFKYIHSGDFVYFVHSFYASDCEESVIAKTDYGIPITAAVAKKNVCGCQFHPEKSGETGLKILKAFCEAEVLE